MPQASRQFAKRELENVREDIYRKDPRPLSGFELFPQRGEAIPDYKKYHVIRQYEMVGHSQWIDEMGDDFPRADIVVDEDQFNLRAHGCAYGFTDDEIAAAEDNNRDLRRKRGMSARRACRQRNNHAMFFGDTSVGLFGFINFPGVPRVYFDNKINKNTGADTIYNELTAFIDTIDEINQTLVSADVVCLPPEQFNHIRKRRFNTGSGDRILGSIREAYSDAAGEPETEFRKIPELEGAGPDGEDVLIAFVDDDESFGHLLPRPFTQEPPEIDFPESVIKTHSKTGGMAADQPLHMCIGILPK